MISDAFECPVSEDECLKLGPLNSDLGSGYALELILESLCDLLRFLSWRVRKKYSAMGATRATTTIGTTMAGIRVLRGMPWEGGGEVCDGAALCKEVDEVLVVDDGKVVRVGLSVAEMITAGAVSVPVGKICDGSEDDASS
jgi:hypothetical protein